MEATNEYPRRIKALVGRSPNTFFSMMQEDGSQLPADNLIVPIVVQATTHREVIPIGTAFFVSARGVIATAKHVADEAEHNGVPLTLQFLPGPAYTQRRIEKWIRHETADVALAILEAAHHSKQSEEWHDPFLSISASTVASQAAVTTFAYPDIVPESSAEKPLKLWCNPEFYEGRVHEHFINGRDASMIPWPCYHTSMFIHGGASGGPVFDERGDVIGINCTQFESDNPTADSYVSDARALIELIETHIAIDDRPSEKAFRLIRTCA